MKNRALLLSALVCVTAASAGEPVTVFGLPLGGKPAKPFAVCREVATAEARPCWVDKPRIIASGGIGYLTLPKNAVPVWAAYASNQLTFRKDGTLTSVEVKVGSGCDFPAMRASIGSRFGAPTADTGPGSILRTVTWDLPTIHVFLVNGDGSEICFARFRTPEDLAQEREYLRKLNDGRPATP